MEGSEVGLFLKNNQWISAAVASASTSGNGTNVIQVDISPEGHKLICEHGMHEFEQKVLERIPESFMDEESWEIRPVRDGFFNSHEFLQQHEIPRVLSWVNEQPRQKLLLDISPEMNCFQGHFPGNPILPGIVQLHWAIGFSISLLGFSEAPYDIKRLKFKNIVQPPSVLELVLSKAPTNMVQFQFNSVGQIHSMGCLVFKEDMSC
jgi:3-hydroxymyristoyl/3-hydroxydecanoyl-(acyl carrier protein) dehydratase